MRNPRRCLDRPTTVHWVRREPPHTQEIYPPPGFLPGEIRAGGYLRRVSPIHSLCVDPIEVHFNCPDVKQYTEWPKKVIVIKSY